MKKGVVFHIKPELAAVPIDGNCYANRWWMSHPEPDSKISKNT